MSVSIKSGLMIAGAVVAIVGILAIAVPAFTTQQTSDVANIGSLKLTATTEKSHVVPPFVGPTALVLGVVLIGAGFVAKS
jgi:hypothetical protein